MLHLGKATKIGLVTAYADARWNVLNYVQARSGALGDTSPEKRSTVAYWVIITATITKLLKITAREPWPFPTRRPFWSATAVRGRRSVA